MKSFSHVSDDVQQALDRMREEFHPDLDGVTVSALFVFDDEASSDQVLKHGGYPALATVKITAVRDRVLGVADAVIVIDRASWLTLTAEARDALLDHELYHLERSIDEESGLPKSDAADRPKLKIRLHDHQFGWFDEIAKRHGVHSAEVRQAKALIDSTQQLYFDFGAARPRGGNGRKGAETRPN